MTEWNLSVRLTGQGSDLARTLRGLSRDANSASRDVQSLRRDLQQLHRDARSPLRVRLSVDAARLRSDVRAALNTAGSGQGISVRLNVDPRRLRADAQTAIRTASSGLDMTVDLSLNARGISRLRSGARDAAHSLNTLQRAARDAKNELEELEARSLTTAAAIRRIATAAGRARGRLDGLSGGTRTFRTDLDDLDGSLTRVAGSLTGLRGRVGGLSNNSGGGLRGLGLGSLLPIASAAVPLVAGLTSSLSSLPGTLAAATGPAAAFGIALAGQVERLTEVADAEKKYQDAIREHGKSSAEAMEAQRAYQQMLAELPPEAQKAAVALSGLKANFKAWSDDMAGFTMAPVTKGIAVLNQLLPRLTPHVGTASAQLTRLMDVAGGAVSTPGFDAMAERFADFTDRQLDEMTDGVIHFLRVLSEGGPVTDGPLAEFIALAKSSGPAAREALQAISEAVVTLLRASAEAGPTMLTLVTAAAKLVAALPPELVGIILQVATALKLLQLSGAGMAALAAGVGRVRAAIAGLATTSAAAGGGLAGLRAAFLSLGLAARASIVVAGIALIAVGLHKLMSLGQEAPPNIDKLTTSLGKLGQSGKATGELSRGFGKDLDDLYDKVRNITDPALIDNLQNGLVKVFSLGFADSTPSKEAREWLDGIDEGLTNLVKGGKADQAAAALEKMKAAYAKDGGDVSKFTGQLDGYKAALADVQFEQELAAASMGLFGKAAQDTQAKLAAQKQSADGLRQSIIALNDVNRAAGSAMSAFEQSIDDTTKAIKDHAGVLKMRDGELDLGSAKSREAEKALSDLAANTDAAATAAREQGKSWEYVSGIQKRGRQAFIDAADAMGLTKAQAKALADTYLSIPEKKTASVEMRIEDAVAGLDAVIEAIEKTPDAKSVTVKALTDDAQSMLRGLGFEITKLKDGSFRVTAETSTAQASLGQVQSMRDGLSDKTITIDARTQDTINSLQGVQDKVAATKGKTVTMKAPTAEARHQLELLGFKIRDTKGKNVVISVPTGSQRANVSALASSIAALRSKTVTITTHYVITGNQARRSGAHGSQLANANGNIVDFYADGGIQRGGMRSFAGGSERHVAQFARAGTWRMWAEPETGGEAYIPLAQSKRPRSRAIAEQTVRRLGGDPEAIQWNAAGSITDWRYDPQTGSLYSGSEITSAGNKTRKVKVKVKGKTTTKEVEYFDLGAVESKLRSASKATQAWNKDLQRVADRVGGDVAEALASMGAEGAKLADKMANGSTKYINEMAAALRGLQAAAKASLTDYTRQLTTANKMNKTFADNLAKLASQGYGDLAGQLAAQNDEAAQQLAAAAVKDKGKASSANAAAKAANTALTADQVQDLVQIIAAISKPTTGIHDVAAKTGLGEDVIIDIANKAKGQIASSLGSRAGRFMGDLKKANAHQAYADGGIRAGMYATKAGIIRFAEPETGGEAYLPLAASKRRTAMPVLANVASRFGVGLTDANAGKVVVIREQGPLVGTQTWNVTSGGNAADTARRIDADNAYQLRRLARGGVGARG